MQQVQFNDVLFATHGFIINVLICVQCIFYERGNQSITDIAKGLLIAIYSPAIILTVFFICDGVNKYYYISFFSYCKLMLTLFKYIPQVRGVCFEDSNVLCSQKNLNWDYNWTTTKSKIKNEFLITLFIHLGIFQLQKEIDGWFHDRLLFPRYYRWFI